MSDFNDFEDHAAGTTEEDPVADFMARQKEQLEGIDDDLAFNAGGNDFQPQAGFEQNNQWGNDDFGNNDFIGTGANNDFVGAGAGTNEYENFEGDFGQAGLNIDPPKPAEPSDAFSAIRQADKQRQEPEKIRLWRVEQQERLKKKDEESEKQKAEWRAVAKKELADWYKHHDEQLDKKRRVNREAEREFIAQRDDTVPGHEWERIGRLCDFNAKGVRQQKDVSRMRSILLQLKQTPLVKP